MSVNAYRAPGPFQQATAWVSITELLLQATIVALVDLVGFFHRYRLPRGTKRYLEKLVGEIIAVEEVRDKKTNRLLGYIYRIPRPHKHLREISGWLQDNKVTVSWLDIAFDFAFPDSLDAMHVCSLLRNHLWIIRGARGQRMVFEQTGNFYSIDTEGRDRPPRLFRVYLRADNTLRIELALFRAATIRRYVRRPDEILDYDPGDIFENEFCLRFVKPSAVKRQEEAWLAEHERAIILGKVRRRYKPPTGVFKRLADSRYLPTEIKRFNLGNGIGWALSK